MAWPPSPVSTPSRLACVRPEVLATITRLGFVQSFGQHRMFKTLAEGIPQNVEYRNG